MTQKRPCDMCPVGGRFNAQDYTCSSADPNDGLPVTCVGEWAEDKHKRVQKYVEISRAARRKFVRSAGATFIDLYAGPGRSRIMATDKLINGSALTAVKAASGSDAMFTDVYLGDINLSFMEAAETRLRAAGVQPKCYVGPADQTVEEQCRELRTGALNVAFLDPYDLGTLNFSIIERLSREKRMDIIAHISLHDLQRNLERYIGQQDSPLDNFAPGWREIIDPEKQTPAEMRISILSYWKNSFRALNMTAAEGVEKVTGTRNQNLYWLVFAAAHPLANRFWEAIRDIDPQHSLL